MASLGVSIYATHSLLPLLPQSDVWVRVGTVANPLAFGGKAQGTLAFTVLPLTPGSQYVFRVNCFNSCGVRGVMDGEGMRGVMLTS